MTEEPLYDHGHPDVPPGADTHSRKTRSKNSESLKVEQYKNRKQLQTYQNDLVNHFIDN